MIIGDPKQLGNLLMTVPVSLWLAMAHTPMAKYIHTQSTTASQRDIDTRFQSMIPVEMGSAASMVLVPTNYFSMILWLGQERPSELTIPTPLVTAWQICRICQVLNQVPAQVAHFNQVANLATCPQPAGNLPFSQAAGLPLSQAKIQALALVSVQVQAQYQAMNLQSVHSLHHCQLVFQAWIPPVCHPISRQEPQVKSPPVCHHIFHQ